MLDPSIMCGSLYMSLYIIFLPLETYRFVTVNTIKDHLFTLDSHYKLIYHRRDVKF